MEKIVEKEINNITHERLQKLLEYVHHLGKNKQKVVYGIEEYKGLKIWEHELVGKIGIEYNVVDNSGASVWLKIKRLIRVAPPAIPESIQDWIVVDKNPAKYPQIKEKIIKTLPAKEANKRLSNKMTIENETADTLIKDNDEDALKDTILYLENNPQIKKNIDRYLSEDWQPWADNEKPRRETIRMYESLFSLQQNIETQGDEQAVELIWGVGISRWLYDGYKIEHPLIEKAIEIDIDKQDGAILIRPRNAEPVIADSPYLALNNPGIGELLDFSDNHFSELGDEIEFSPYVEKSYAPVLKEAATILSESGVYKSKTEHEKANKIGEMLEISNSWIVFSRPRSTTAFVQDIKRLQDKLQSLTVDDIPEPIKKLVTELDDKVSVQKANKHSSQVNTELFLPKVYNSSQVEIINRLESNNAVVVQGPPGTGKTHTIANIICHYLATGRRVLVTSKGESALSVLQEQIPKELRALTISLLTSEKQGVKQLEKAIGLLSNMVVQNNPLTLEETLSAKQLRVDELNAEIINIDKQIEQWGQKQTSDIDSKLKNEAENVKTAMDLAQLVVDDKHKYQWLPDEFGNGEPSPLTFTDTDIDEMRGLRQQVGKDIVYVDKMLPNKQDLPNSANIVAIHADLLKLAEIKATARQYQISLPSTPEEKDIDNAKHLIDSLKNLSELIIAFKENPWLKPMFHLWRKKSTSTSINRKRMDGLYVKLSKIIEKRQLFVDTLVEIPKQNGCFAEVCSALENLSTNKKAFGFFQFGKKEAKIIIEQARVNGEVPQDSKQWFLVLVYIKYQKNVKDFIVRWNHIAQELALPKFKYEYGDNFRPLQDIYDLISQAIAIARKSPEIEAQITRMFPSYIAPSNVFEDAKQLDELIEEIECYLAQANLSARNDLLNTLVDNLSKSDTDVVEHIKFFVKDKVGNSEYSIDDIGEEWSRWRAELDRVIELTPAFEQMKAIASKISASGAPIWAEKLITEPPLADKDSLTPTDWAKAWQWRQRIQYLQAIDGREALKALSKRRLTLDKELKKVFSDLIYTKTNIGLQSSMTESVQGALTRFTNAIGKIGKGTGIRAPRYRRDAYQAMQECYAGVPCWIMPIWRISESLPADFASFDLVIIDEASQSDITALPAILRAKKLLIVGDDKQVSPTAAFIKEDDIKQLIDKYLDKMPHQDSLVPGVSIYDLASTLFPNQRIMLTEHFRCVEPIIRFSMQFYPQVLVPLRIAKASEKLTPPLVDVYVNGGIRDERRKVNELEAEAIITEIKALVSDEKYKERSIGIISLIGMYQAKYIQDKLLREIGEDVFQKHKIACGDAATFQGKERDIIFLSMVVGPSQGKAMTQKSEEQRMNVALSRARDRMYLYRSIEQSDLSNQDDLRLKILQHMASPMTEQINSSNHTALNSLAPDSEEAENGLDLCESDFERDVYKRLVAKGYCVTPQVKVGNFSIDLVVEGDNDRRLAIELDGDRYHPPKQWMKDWQRQRTMERVGWTFWRCWGSNYLIDPDGCINDLITLLENMKIYPLCYEASQVEASYAESNEITRCI